MTDGAESKKMTSKQLHINISVPNLVTICVDRSQDEEMAGRLYHCYTKEPWIFSNVVQLLRQMEELFDGIPFPQASTQTRYFIKQVPSSPTRLKKVAEQRDLLQYRGEKGTFVAWVRFRQNSAWQGELVWMEQERQEAFLSTLEFIKLVSHALTV